MADALFMRLQRRTPSATGHSCDILIKNLATFCQWLKCFCKAESNCSELNFLTEEILKQHNIENVTWLFLITLSGSTMKKSNKGARKKWREKK